MSLLIKTIPQKATYVLATFDASPAEQALANEVLPGVADETIINPYFALLTPGQGLEIVGNTININGTLVFDNPRCWFLHKGTIQASAGAVYPIAQFGNVAGALYSSRSMNLTFGILQGSVRNGHGIEVLGHCDFSIVNFEEIGDTDRGISFPQNGAVKGEVYFHYQGIGVATSNNYGIYFEPVGAFNDNMEGIQLHGGFIANSQVAGIQTNNADVAGLYVEGVLDQVVFPAALDAYIGSPGCVLNVKWIRDLFTVFPAETHCTMNNFGDEHKALGRKSVWGIDFTNWQTAVVGTGVATRGIDRFYSATGANAGSTAEIYKALYRFGNTSSQVNYDTKLTIEGSIAVENSVATGATYLMIAANHTPVDPGSQAIGFRIDNQAAKGIYYGTALHVVDLATAVAATPAIVTCVLLPNFGIYWYINGYLVGMATADLPTGAPVNHFLSMSVRNGVTAANYTCMGSALVRMVN